MKDNNITSLNQWKKFRKENNIKNIPYKLSRTYSKSWKGQPHFFGTETFTYNEAKEFIKDFNIKSSRDYLKFLRTKNSVINLPAVPSRKYKGKGWSGWKEFLGKE